MLKMKIVSTRVRTAAWCSTQRKPSAMSCRMCVPARPASRAVRRQDDPRHQHRAERHDHRLRAERPGGADGEQRRTQRRAGQLVDRDEARSAAARSRSPGRPGPPASAAASASCCRRTPRRCPARTAPTSTPAIDTWSVATASVSTASTAARARSTHHHDQAPVQPVGQRPGDQPEQQRRQPLHRRRERHQERVVGQRRDQQRAGGERDAVAEVGRPRRGEQPPEADAEACRRGDFGKAAHKADSLLTAADLGASI